MKIVINEKVHQVDVDPATPLLWVLRDVLGLTGTKFGCGVAMCGACTVHINGQPTRSCVTPISTIAGRKITTIEGISADGNHPLQKAWVEHSVPQCGYCQSGQLMTAVAFLKSNAKPSRTQIVEAMNGHICRCGTYKQIADAIESTAKAHKS